MNYKTKIKIFENFSIKKLEEEVNEFIKDKNIQDIKIAIYKDCTTILIHYFDEEDIWGVKNEKNKMANFKC